MNFCGPEFQRPCNSPLTPTLKPSARNSSPFSTNICRWRPRPRSALVDLACARVVAPLAAAPVRPRVAAAGNPPEFGGRNANILQQFVHREELSRRRIYHCFNPQGVGIIAASLLSFGTEEQKQRWAVPILRADKTASLGMSEPGAGSDLAGLRTKAELVGDHFVVNGQKVWTSGAHDADVILTFVRTDPDAPRHKGISALLIPTETPGFSAAPSPRSMTPTSWTSTRCSSTTSGCPRTTFSARSTVDGGSPTGRSATNAP